ncbi:CPBP family intramembrane glutamic endopeptidase [Xanthocytophaga flava]|uniref:CPBP family intramembrane glutamic endopeptidase n=1 Tax=Xanthocytophaga flava TaxID=3048013 RepID=UPI0028D7A218|nr:type II CAAX endopeptidase family protein [Xanthocytophaga flavus]MDJ1466473.1 type II CAAX endopeptidase family protein [Xanthocytophaga flavus]
MQTTNHFRSLSLFFVFAYLITWCIWAPYYLPSLFPVSWHTDPVFHYAGLAGPLLASLLATAIQNGKAGIRLLVHRITTLGSSLWAILAALGIPFVVVLFSQIISAIVDHEPISFRGLSTSREMPGLSWFTFAAINIFVVGIGEEAGWRGFVLPRLQGSMTAMKASILLTIFWAIWHWPLFFYPLSGYYHMDIFGIAGWLFSLLLGSILFAWLFNSSGGSVLTCAIFHGMMDIMFISAFPNTHLASYNGMLITILGFVVINRFSAQNLSRKERITTTE